MAEKVEEVKKEEKVEEVKKVEEKQRFSIVDVPTQTTPLIVDNETNTHYDQLAALQKLLNDIALIKKGLQ